MSGSAMQGSCNMSDQDTRGHHSLLRDLIRSTHVTVCVCVCVCVWLCVAVCVTVCVCVCKEHICHAAEASLLRHTSNTKHSPHS